MFLCSLTDVGIGDNSCSRLKSHDSKIARPDYMKRSGLFEQVVFFSRGSTKQTKSARSTGPARFV